MSLPAGTSVINGFAVSPDGALYVTPSGTASITGGTIKGANVPWSLSQSAVPFIHVSSGSIGNNGALTAITALNRTYSGGAWVYYPANSIAAATAAGWYWTVFSSTTAGTIFNSTYTSGTPTIGTQTAFSTTGPGAFTGDTTERAGPTITLPGGAMGANGLVRAYTNWAMTSSASAKIPRLRFGGAAGAAYLAPSPTTQVAYADLRVIQNAGVTNSQKGANQILAGGFGQTGSAGDITSSVDSTADTTIVVSLVKVLATDNLVLDNYLMEVLFAA